MKYFIDTTDRRNEFVYKILKEHNKPCFVYLENINKIQKGDVIIFSPAKKFSLEEVSFLNNEITVFCGNIEENIKSIFNKKIIKVVNFLKDELFSIENAKLTAQGVLAIILFSIEKSILDTKVLFLGGGRITKASATLLKKIGFKTDVASYSLIEFHNANFYADNAFFDNGFIPYLSQYDVIVNTRPVKFVTEKMIDNISENCNFIETASVCCLDKDKKYKFNYLLAPALPQRFTPYSAGKLIVERIFGEENEWLKI